MKTPVLNIEAWKEVSRCGRNGHHHLLCHPSLFQVPDKHPGEGDGEGSSGGVGVDHGYGGVDSGVDGGGDNEYISRACPPGFQSLHKYHTDHNERYDDDDVMSTAALARS